VSSPYSVGDAGLPDEDQVPATGDWTYGTKRAGRYSSNGSKQSLQAAGIAFVLALSPLTSVADPWFAERKREATASFAVLVYPYPRRRITLADARNLALQILAAAEAERHRIVEDEALRAFPLEGLD